MRHATSLLCLAIGAAAVTGCAEPSATAPPSQPPASSTAPSSGDAAADATPPPDDVLQQVSAALTEVGVEQLGPGDRFLWHPDVAGAWRGGTAFAWVVDPASVDQVAEVRGSAPLQGKREQVSAVVHGPELAMVRVPCDDVVVDVAAGVNVKRGTSEQDDAVDLAEALYPALGC
jgi:hypothetical protein